MPTRLLGLAACMLVALSIGVSPTQAQGVSVTDTTINVTWSAPSKHTPKGYRVCWKEGDSWNPCVFHATATFGTGTFGHTITGLKSLTKYTVRVECYCKGKLDTKWREIFTLKTWTLKSTTGSVGSDSLTVSSTTNDSITVSVAYKSSSVFDMVRVCMRKVFWTVVLPPPTCGIRTPGPVGMFQDQWNPTNPQSFTFPNLQPGTRYTFMAFGFQPGKSLGSQIGKPGIAKTTGHKFPWWFVVAVNDDHPDLAQAWLNQVETHYAAMPISRTTSAAAMHTARAGVSGVPILEWGPLGVHTATLPTGRVDPTAGRSDAPDTPARADALPDGAAYFVAGNGDLQTSSPASSLAEVYVASTDTWHALAPMLHARRGHLLDRLRDGRILASGGDGGPDTALIPAAEVYNPATGAWQATGPMARPRKLHATVRLEDGSIVALGGATPGFIADVERFDPASGTWSAFGSLQVARDRHTATRLPDGTILVGGGRGAAGRLKSVERFDPATGVSTLVGNLATERAFHTATLVGDRYVVFIGGQGGGGLGFPPKAERFDFVTGEITELGPLNAPRKSHAVVVMPGGRLLVVGGDQNGLLSSVERFDPETGTFEEVGQMGTPRTDLGAVMGPDGRVRAIGGRGPAGLLASSERFDARSALFRHLDTQYEITPPETLGGTTLGSERLTGRTSAGETSAGEMRGASASRALAGDTVSLGEIWYAIASATGEDIGEPMGLFAFMAESDTTLFDDWQTEPELAAAGLDLRGWMEQNHPDLLASLDAEIAAENEGTEPAGRISNISTRAHVGTGDNVMIGGFIVAGGPAQVVMRAIGPDLSNRGVSGVLANPQLALHRGASPAPLAVNDDWQRDAPWLGQIPSGLRPADPREAVIAVTLEPGEYGAIVRGVGGTTGVALVEVFHVGGDGRLSNISTRAHVGTGDNVMIGGYIVSGGPAQVVMRAIGPDLARRGVPGALPNPYLALHRGASPTPLAVNDDWQRDAPWLDLIPSGLRPIDPREAVIVSTQDAGEYGAIVRGVGGTTGVALVEAFQVR